MIILKTTKQINKIKKACQIVKQTLDLIEGNIKPGVTTLQLDKIAENYIRSQKAIPSFKGYGGFPNTICASPNDQVVHGIPNNEPLKEGDIISIDVGAYIGGYHGDAARTFTVGKVDTKTQKLIDVTKECFYEGIKDLKIGDHIGDIGARIEKHAKKHGYGVVKELIGHGLGKNLHEDPQVPNFGIMGTGPKIEEGLVIAIEPMINMGTENVYFGTDGWTCKTTDGRPSAHYENTIAITNKGVEILTK